MHIHTESEISKEKREDNIKKRKGKTRKGKARNGAAPKNERNKNVRKSADGDF